LINHRCQWNYSRETWHESIDFDPTFLPPYYTETVNDVVDEWFFLFMSIVRQKSSYSYLVAWHEDRECFLVLVVVGGGGTRQQTRRNGASCEIRSIPKPA
jgi:hypothetical protein